MDHSAYLAHLDEECGLLRAAALAVPRDAPVPTCGDWTVDDLLGHLAAGYRRAAAAVAERAEPADVLLDRSEPADAVADLAAAHAGLQEVLQAREPGDSAWTWDPSDPTAGFWSRRMAHETAVHRADLDLALGRVPRLDHALASDGVDELLRVFAEGDWSDVPQPGPAATVALRVPGRAWTVRAEPEHLAVRDGVDGPDGPWGAADATVRAAPTSLLLWLWGRPHGDLDVSGERSLADALQARLAAVTT